jgi:DNA-binding CsgD family transcriptional regulator
MADIAALRELGLTLREAEILSLLVDGVAIESLARRMNVSERTIRKHLGNVYRKLGVSTRAAATAQAIDAMHRDVGLTT